MLGFWSPREATLASGDLSVLPEPQGMSSPILGEQVRNIPGLQNNPDKDSLKVLPRGGGLQAQARLLLRSFHCEMSRWSPGGSAGPGLTPTVLPTYDPTRYTTHLGSLVYQ